VCPRRKHIEDRELGGVGDRPAERLELLPDASGHRDGTLDMRTEPLPSGRGERQKQPQTMKRRDHCTLLRYGSTLATLDGMKLVEA